MIRWKAMLGRAPQRNSHLELRACLQPSCQALLWIVLASLARLAASRQLAQAPWEEPPPAVLPVDPANKTVYVNATVYAPKAAFPAGQALANAIASYPNPKFDNPNGWRFKTISNASIVLGTQFPAGIARLQSISNAKLAPAIALSGANVESPGATGILARTRANAYPGLQYGATLAKSDYRAVSTAPFEPTNKLTNPVVVFMAQDVSAGQGQAVNLINVDAEGKNLVVGDARGETRSGRWYMAPGNAIMGSRFNLKGSQTAVFSRNRARANFGSSTSGVLHMLSSEGLIPREHLRNGLRRDAYFLVDTGSIARADNRAFTDVGAAQAGNIQLVKSANAGSTTVGLAQARTAVGNSVAGGLNVAYAENGDIYLGDYWDELSNPGNAVVATNYGRGSSQAGQVNIGLSLNRDIRIGGTVAATAVQGSATAGAFELGNGYGEVELDQDVTAVTSEYTASAGNVGVAVAQQRGAVVTNTIAKTDIGPALSYGISTSVVGVQNSAVSSTTATTATGPAASLSASQAVGGVASESQGASLAKTTTGNALSVGSAFSGSALQGRGVATSTGITSDGTALSTGWSGVVSANSDASAASSAVSGTGNAGSVAQAYGLGVLEGKATTASSAGTTAGSVASGALSAAVGLIQAQSTAASSGQTRDGNAQSLAGALSLAGVNSVARATSSGATPTGDVQSRAAAAGLGLFHGEANAISAAGTGCIDCVSDAVANAFSSGLVADSTAAATADSPVNPGNALANAVAVGLISRTSNGGSSRVAVGPGQALAGSLAVSLPPGGTQAIQAAIRAANPAAAAAAAASARRPPPA